MSNLFEATAGHNDNYLVQEVCQKYKVLRDIDFDGTATRYFQTPRKDARH